METQLGKAKTIPALLSEWARDRGAKKAYTFLDNQERECITFTYAQLDKAVRSLAAHIQRIAEPGDRVLITATENQSLIRAFLACQYAGVIPVPVFPLTSARPVRRIATLSAIAEDCAATVVLSADAARLQAAIATVAPALAERTWIAPDDIDAEAAAHFRPVPTEPEQVAFLQYTSGSTSTPKGVMVTHRSLLRNEEMIAHYLGLTEADVIISWLPLFHDMGLIGMTLQALYLGAHAVIMPPLAFVQRPARWLRTISKYQGTMSGAPNFAYDQCVSGSRQPSGGNSTSAAGGWRSAAPSRSARPP